MNELATINERIASLDETATPEQIAETLGLLENLTGRAKELKVELESAMIGWIQANGDLTIGPIRYYVGVAKTTKCKSVRDTIERLLTLTEGDLDSIASLLSSNAWKPGAVREELEKRGADSAFDELFTTTSEDELREGKPKLQKFNADFDRRRIKGDPAGDAMKKAHEDQPF